MGGPCTQSWVQQNNYYTKIKHGIKSPLGGFVLYWSFAEESLKMVIHKHCHAFWKHYTLEDQGRFCPIDNPWQRRGRSFAGLHVMVWKIQWERCAKHSRPHSTGIVGKLLWFSQVDVGEYKRAKHVPISGPPMVWQLYKRYIASTCEH